MKPIFRVHIFLLASLCFSEASMLDAILEPVHGRRGVTAKPEQAETSVAPKTPIPAPKQYYTLGTEAFCQALKAQIVQYYQITEGELKIEPVQGWHELNIPTEDWEFEIVQFPSGPLTSKILLQYRINSGGQSFGPYRLFARCQLWDDVYVAQRRLARGEALAEDKVTKERVDILRLAHKPVSIKGVDLDSHELMQTLSSGSALLWRDVKRRPTVTKGKVIDIMVEEGSMQIKMKAEVLQSGTKGEFVPVRNLNSRKDFKAEILDENTAKIYF